MRLSTRTRIFVWLPRRAMDRRSPAGGGDEVVDSSHSLGDPLALNTRDLSTPTVPTRTDPPAAAQLSSIHHMLGGGPVPTR